ncbi:diguanylate cyclase [Fusibacter sp. Q10-2]|uniref:Diguanylate cyclase n=2 Tax=Fusibacter ferrireducens TaxID=2785058 RepID=A0ABR9ZPX5_9FIRM|nr:diguanylate cyclase [Fusibacter ferrireducens]
MDFIKFRNLILSSEVTLMGKILVYAKERDYAKYTSTLAEAWRLSISGLSEALIQASYRSESIPEIGPDEDFSKNKIAEFGVMEAKRHRSRGITLEMFLGLMKYYHQSYIDLIAESDFSTEEKVFFSQYIKRYFDHVELGFITEWTTLSESTKVQNLQAQNRDITNEKNKYLTVFESIYDPIVLVDQDNRIENFNHQAAVAFADTNVSGKKYYSDTDMENTFTWLKNEIDQFMKLKKEEISIEQTLSTKLGQKTYVIKLKKMMDITERYAGTVVTFSDITDRLEFERQLKAQNEKLEYYAYTDHMTGVLNRRTGLFTLEKELASIKSKSLSVCFMDIDGLKYVNDKYGHTEGDNLINFIVTTIKEKISLKDSISRFGGDEFLIIFPECSYSEAEVVIRSIIEALTDHDNKGIDAYKHVFSYGIVEVLRASDYDLDDIIKLADQRMYQNKSNKKKRIDKRT